MNIYKASVCPLDCPNTCSLAVKVENDRVIAVRSSRANPLTHGAICAKVAHHYPEFVHGSNRLRHPRRSRCRQYRYTNHRVRCQDCGGWDRSFIATTASDQNG